MKIEKYKKYTKGRYKIFLDKGGEVLLYEEVILKYGLLLKKEISEEELRQIDNDNQEYEVYYGALDNIKARFKSIYEVGEYLRKKQYREDLIKKAIDKLIKQGYLNDQVFTKSYINNQILTTNKGPKKIEKELLDKKIDKDIIEKEIEIYTKEEEREKINKLINKMLKSNHTKGGNVLKQKIYNDLINLGYDSSTINEIINNYQFNNNSDIASREYEKLKRKLSRKYSGSELEYKIKERLYQKGLYYEE